MHQRNASPAIDPSPVDPALFKDAQSVRGLVIGLALSAMLWVPLCLIVPRLL